MTAAKPAYLLRGEDQALLAEALRSLLHDLVGGEEPGLAVEDLTADDLEVGTVIDACLTPPFLTSRRIVLVRDAGRFGADDASRLVAYLEDPLPTTSLVLVAGGGQVPPRLVAAVKRIGAVVEAGLPTGRARSQWLSERLRDAPVHLTPEARNLLSAHLGEDLGRLGTVLDLLATAYGDGARVEEAEVEPFLGEAGSVTPWELTDAIDAGDTGRAIDALHRLVAAGERHPLVVMATLHRHYQAMLRLDGAGVSSEAEAASLLGIHPFRAKKALAQSRALGWRGLARAVRWLGEADLALRGAKEWSDEAVLEVLVARLSRLGPRVAAGRG